MALPSGEKATEEYEPLFPAGVTSLQICPSATLTSMMEQPVHVPPPQPPLASSTTANDVLFGMNATSENVRELPVWVMPSWITVRLLAHITAAVSSLKVAATYMSFGLQSNAVTYALLPSTRS